MSTQSNETPDSSPVLFYECPHYYLSNFSAFMVDWGDRTWMTSEHAYQAAKFLTGLPLMLPGADNSKGERILDIVDKIQAARSAHDAKKIARAHLSEIPEWSEGQKLTAMREILWFKLAQHTWIQTMLLKTDDRELVEDSPKDAFWGRGPHGTGRNELGKIWMSLRADLFEQASAV